MIQFTLFTQCPQPKKTGIGVLSVDGKQSAMFFSGNADNDSRILAELENVVIMHASSDTLVLSGKEPMGLSKAGSRIFRYQEWVLKSPDNK